jgi:hypothetical protein
LLVQCSIISLFPTADRERDRKENETSASDNADTLGSLKILYTPATAVTRDIILRANRTFDTAGDLIALADQVANCSQFFLDNFNDSQLMAVDKVCGTLAPQSITTAVLLLAVRWIGHLQAKRSGLHIFCEHQFRQLGTDSRLAQQFITQQHLVHHVNSTQYVCSFS